jgi:hypothetical protein
VSRPSAVPSTLQALVAKRVAGVIVSGFDFCDEETAPLCERQKAALLTAALLVFDGMQAELDGLREIERVIAELRGSNDKPP